MTSKSASTPEIVDLPRVVAVVILRGIAGRDVPASEHLGWLAKLRALLDTTSGTFHPSGLDPVVLSWNTLAEAVVQLADVVRELDPPHEHRHHGTLAIGLCSGEVVMLPDGRVFGTTVSRSWRLAVLGEQRGEMLLAGPAIDLPEGFGVHQARATDVQRSGFPFQHLNDYRDAPEAGSLDRNRGSPQAVPRWPTFEP